MIDQAIAQLFGDQPLQGFQFRIDEFDHLAGFHVDQVVMMRLGRGFIARATVAEIVQTMPDVRVIFVSGYAEDALTEMQARIPNSVFLPKPFSLSDLAATVQGQMLH